MHYKVWRSEEEMQGMRRREFLQAGTAAGLGAWTGLHLGSKTAEAQAGQQPILSGADFPADDYQAPDWLRYARALHFDGFSPPVYPHMKDFDARRLVQTVVGLGGDSLRFQPIGYWAYYPSKSFRVHPELGGRDLIDEVTQESRRLGIHCYCYTGYGHPFMKVGWVDQHPEYADWVLRNPEGKPYGTYGHIGWASLQRVCATGDAYRAGIRQVVRELCAHDIEGVYFDEPSPFGYSGICFCDSCRKNFRKSSGLDLDRLAPLAKLNGLPFDAQDIRTGQVDMKVLTTWYAWADALVREDMLDFRRIIHGSGKFMQCHNGSAWKGGALPLQYRIPDGFMVEASRETYDRLTTGMMGASMARPYKKLAQMYMGSYAVAWFGEPAHEQPWVTHCANLEDSDEVRMEGFTGLACGNVPFYATANRLYSKVGSGSAEPAKEVFALMKRMETIHKDSVPVPYMTIVPTWESLQLWREKGKSWNWPMMSGGMGLALLDGRISFDVNPSTEMSEAWLAGQKVIALCGASGISDEEAKRLTAWVERGGGLLATYDSGLYDEQGRLRQDGGALREVLGVKMKGKPLESQPECYYRVKEGHAALGDYGAGAIVEGDGRLVPVEALGGARTIAECWNLGTGEVRGPAIVVNSYGRGRTVYVSGSLEANYLYDRVESTKRLLRSMVEYLGREAPQPFKLKAPRGVYGVLRQATNGDRILWLLANVGFKDAAVGRMRQEFVPVENVEVSLRVPDGRKVKGMHLLRADHPIPHRLEDGYATVTIPALHIAEVLHLELA
jgi:hypothetical protein